MASFERNHGLFMAEPHTRRRDVEAENDDLREQIETLKERLSEREEFIKDLEEQIRVLDPKENKGEE